MGKEPRRKKLILVILGGILIVLPVYAAVFDTDLIPGADNAFDIGSATQKWYNLSISNLLNLGQFESDPGFGQNGSIYYNTGSKEFRLYSNGAWRPLSGEWSSASAGSFYEKSIYTTKAVGIGTSPLSNYGLTLKGDLIIANPPQNNNPAVGYGAGSTNSPLIYYYGTRASSTIFFQGYAFIKSNNNILAIIPYDQMLVGNNATSSDFSGSPPYLLEVKSNGANTARLGSNSADTVIVGGGAGKITVGTVDPVYDVAGEKYATYVPGALGVKEETTGAFTIESSKCKIQNDNLKSEICEYAIDFNKVERGSDLWLFYQITDFGNDWDKLSVLITPDSKQNVWYKKLPESKKLVIYSEHPSEISYRLTAPRFDHASWSNTTKDDVNGLEVKEK